MPPPTKNSSITNDLDLVQNDLLPEILKNKFKHSECKSLKEIKTQTYPYSTIRIVQLIDEQKTVITLFIKRITVPNKELAIVKKALLDEASLLLQLNKEMAGETVELIHSFPEQQIIVTKECPGKATDLLINAYSFWWNNSLKQTKFRNNMPTLFGNWLKQYHLVTGQKNQDLTAWYNYLTGEMIWRIRALKLLLPEHSELFEETSSIFISRLNQIDKQGHTCTYHGDFAPHNIFYTDNKVRVIDFYDAQTGHPLIDLINLISSMATRSESPLYPKSRVKKFCHQFLTAYGQIPDEKPELASLLLLLQSIKKLLVLENSNPSRIDNKLINHYAKCLYIQHLEDHVFEKNNAKKIGPWPFLDLSTLTSLSKFEGKFL